MLYLIFIIIVSGIILLFSLYNKVVKDQNNIIMENNREFNENVPYKKFFPYVTPNIIWLYVIGLFAIFIVGRFTLCGQSETEYKNQEVQMTSDGLLQLDSENYYVYIKNELTKLPKSITEIIVDESISTPYIQDYYNRHVKFGIPNWKLFFLYNRKETKITDWEVDMCGCGGSYTLITDKKY